MQPCAATIFTVNVQQVHFACFNILFRRRPLKRSTAPTPPANAAEGAARVRGLVMKLFDKGDGEGAKGRTGVYARKACSGSPSMPSTGCLTIRKNASPGASMPPPMTGFLAIWMAISRQVILTRLGRFRLPRILPI